jgi:hypothetical protein
MDTRDGVLAAHIAAGSVGSCWELWRSSARAATYRSRACAACVWAVGTVGATVIALLGLDELELWWILPLAVLAIGFAIVGYLATTRRRPGWIRLYAHGQGGAFIALVTAVFVVSVSGAAMAAAWVVPTAVGVALIERRVARIEEEPRPEGGRDDPQAHLLARRGAGQRVPG